MFFNKEKLSLIFSRKDLAREQEYYRRRQVYNLKVESVIRWETVSYGKGLTLNHAPEQFDEDAQQLISLLDLVEQTYENGVCVYKKPGDIKRFKENYSMAIEKYADYAAPGTVEEAKELFFAKEGGRLVMLPCTSVYFRRTLQIRKL